MAAGRRRSAPSTTGGAGHALRAPVWFVFGSVVMGATAALAGMVVLLGIARLLRFFTGRSLSDSPVWDWAGPTAAVLAAVAIVGVTGAFVVHGLVGGGRRSAAGARCRSRAARRVAGGRPLRQRRRGPVHRPRGDAARAHRDRRPRHRTRCRCAPCGTVTLVVTTGCWTCCRCDELEAVCAHELAHLDACRRPLGGRSERLVAPRGHAGLALTVPACSSRPARRSWSGGWSGVRCVARRGRDRLQPRRRHRLRADPPGTPTSWPTWPPCTSAATRRRSARRAPAWPVTAESSPVPQRTPSTPGSSSSTSPTRPPSCASRPRAPTPRRGCSRRRRCRHRRGCERPRRAQRSARNRPRCSYTALLCASPLWLPLTSTFSPSRTSLARPGTIGSSRLVIDSTFVDRASGRRMSCT